LVAGGAVATMVLLWVAVVWPGMVLRRQPPRARPAHHRAAYWPSATGTAADGRGLPGRIATITRTNGSRQLTYNSSHFTPASPTRLG
jgi:hypothetical protein